MKSSGGELFGLTLKLEKAAASHPTSRHFSSRDSKSQQQNHDASTISHTRKRAETAALPLSPHPQVIPVVRAPLPPELTPTNLNSLRILALHPTTRLFSSTPLPQKKKDRKDYSDNTKSSKKKDATPEPTSTIADDPFDLSTLEAGIEKATTKLHADLSLLRTGGRFNPEKLESVRVVVDKEGGRSERLGDLAQVLPKGGRSLNILVGEAEVCFYPPCLLLYLPGFEYVMGGRKRANSVHSMSNPLHQQFKTRI